MNDYMKVWDSEQYARAIGKALGKPFNTRQLLDLQRDNPGVVPAPFGKLGNGYVWQGDVAQAGIRDILQHIGETPERARLSRAASIRQQEEALERKREQFEAEMRQYREQTQFFREQEAATKARLDAEEARHKNRQAIIVDANGRRVS